MSSLQYKLFGNSEHAEDSNKRKELVLPSPFYTAVNVNTFSELKFSVKL